MIYAALKNLERALYMFEACITCPALAVSHIMVEAYKKWTLISLIVNGKVNPLPKYTGGVVNRYVKPLCQPYVDLASAYSTNRADELTAMINKYSEQFVRVSGIFDNLFVHHLML